MTEETIKKILQSKMSDMEIAPNNPEKPMADDFQATRRSTLDLDQVQKKYGKSTDLNEQDASNATSTASDASDDVEVKLVRAKDRTQDDANPLSVRTVILDKNGIVGYQG